MILKGKAGFPAGRESVCVCAGSVSPAERPQERSSRPLSPSIFSFRSRNHATSRALPTRLSCGDDARAAGPGGLLVRATPRTPRRATWRGFWEALRSRSESGRHAGQFSRLSPLSLSSHTQPPLVQPGACAAYGSTPDLPRRARDGVAGAKGGRERAPARRPPLFAHPTFSHFPLFLARPPRPARARRRLPRKAGARGEAGRPQEEEENPHRRHQGVLLLGRRSPCLPGRWNGHALRRLRRRRPGPPPPLELDGRRRSWRPPPDCCRGLCPDGHPRIRGLRGLRRVGLADGAW